MHWLEHSCNGDAARATIDVTSTSASAISSAKKSRLLRSTFTRRSKKLGVKGILAQSPRVFPRAADVKGAGLPQSSSRFSSVPPWNRGRRKSTSSNRGNRPFSNSRRTPRVPEESLVPRRSVSGGRRRCGFPSANLAGRFSSTDAVKSVPACGIQRPNGGRKSTQFRRIHVFFAGHRTGTQLDSVHRPRFAAVAGSQLH